MLWSQGPGRRYQAVTTPPLRPDYTALNMKSLFGQATAILILTGTAILPIEKSEASDAATLLNKQFQLEKALKESGNPYYADAAEYSEWRYNSPHEVWVKSINTVPLFEPFNDPHLLLTITRSGDDYTAVITSEDGWLTCRKDVCALPFVINGEHKWAMRGYVVRKTNSIIIDRYSLAMLMEVSLQYGDFFSIEVQFFGKEQRVFNFRVSDFKALKE